MNFNFYISDILNRLNVGNRHKLKRVELSFNKITLDIIKVLWDLGLIRGFKIKPGNKVMVYLRYYHGTHIFHKLKLVSKPSKRVYWNLQRLFLELDKNNSVIYIVSTKEGLLIGSDCL